MDRIERVKELVTTIKAKYEKIRNARLEQKRNIQSLEEELLNYRNTEAEKVAQAYIAIAELPHSHIQLEKSVDFHCTILPVCEAFDTLALSYLTARVVNRGELVNGELIMVTHERNDGSQKTAVFLPPADGYTIFKIDVPPTERYFIASGKNKNLAKKNLRRLLLQFDQLP